MVLAVCGGALWAVRGEGPRAAEPDDDAGRPASFIAPAQGYHGPDEVFMLVQSWIEASSNVQSLPLGLSPSGRPIPGLEFGAPGAPLHERQGVLLAGSFDGVSQAGTEAVLRTTYALLSQLDLLDPALSFVVVPSPALDALARLHATGDRSGRGLTPVDDDLDGFLDEDAGDDVDGDGLVLEMLLPDAHGPWCFAADARFLIPAGPGDAPRFRRGIEGRDDDGDGLYNEDGVGGINYDAHYPVGWNSPRSDGSAGRWPLEADVPRRLADLVVAREWAMAIVHQGNNGGIAFGSSADGEDEALSRAKERLRLAFERTTGRTVRATAPVRASGRFADWLRIGQGVATLEIAAWGPEAVGIDGRPYRSWAEASRAAGSLVPAGVGSALDRSRSPFDTGRTLSEADTLWAGWLDDVRAGAGFVDWHPVDLGKGVMGWVGGWEPRTRSDPPADNLLEALEGIPEFTIEVVHALPRLEIEVVEAERMGNLLRVAARVVNRGALSTAFAHGPMGVRIELEAPCDASIAAGLAVSSVAELRAGETSETLEWLVRVPEGAAVRVHASAPGIPRVEREVRP